MAAPPHKTLQNLKGEWKLNKSLSDSIEPILAAQGTNSMLRKTIASASVTLAITQSNPEEYSIKQSATSAGIPGTTEQYVLDYEWRMNHDAFFGQVKGRSKWVDLSEAKEIMDPIPGEWEDDGGKVILAEGGKPDESWSASRIWGFEQVGGDRRYTQRVKVSGKDGEEVRVKMVYDFNGEQV